jgi:hypothetical protein
MFPRVHIYKQKTTLLNFNKSVLGQGNWSMMVRSVRGLLENHSLAGLLFVDSSCNFVGYYFVISKQDFFHVLYYFLFV